MVALVQITEGNTIENPTSPGWVLRGSSPSFAAVSDYRTFLFTKQAGASEPGSYTWSKPDAFNWDLIKITIVTYGSGFGLAGISTTWSDPVPGWLSLATP